MLLKNYNLDFSYNACIHIIIIDILFRWVKEYVMNKMWTLNQNTCDGSGNIQVCKICMRECRCSCEKELVGGGY